MLRPRGLADELFQSSRVYQAMVEVRLLYPSDKLEAAMRLAEAIAAEGYSVERSALARDAAFPGLGAEAGKAKVLLLIWSRGLVSAAMAAGGLGEGRRQPNLVEISVDGIEPDFGGEGSRVVLLSGWRGQPFHPGWQRILADIKRLCGTRDAAAKSSRAAPPKAGGKGAAVVPPPANKRRAARAAFAVGALAAAALGAATAFDRAPPTADGRSTTAAVGQPAPVEEAPRVAPVEVEALPAPPAAPALAASAPAPAAERPAPRQATASQRSSPKRLAAVSVPGVKRYSRKYSKTMRLFCQRSGRSTPQCRTFARSMGELRG